MLPGTPPSALPPSLLLVIKFETHFQLKSPSIFHAKLSCMSSLVCFILLKCQETPLLWSLLSQSSARIFISFERVVLHTLRLCFFVFLGLFCVFFLVNFLSTTLFLFSATHQMGLGNAPNMRLSENSKMNQMDLIIKFFGRDFSLLGSVLSLSEELGSQAFLKDLFLFQLHIAITFKLKSLYYYIQEEMHVSVQLQNSSPAHIMWMLMKEFVIYQNTNNTAD